MPHSSLLFYKRLFDFTDLGSLEHGRSAAIDHPMSPLGGKAFRELAGGHQRTPTEELTPTKTIALSALAGTPSWRSAPYIV